MSPRASLQGAAAVGPAEPRCGPGPDRSQADGSLRALRRLEGCFLLAGLLLWPFAASRMPYPAAYLVLDLSALAALGWIGRPARLAVPRAAAAWHLVAGYLIVPVLYSQAGATAGALLAAHDHAPLLADLDRRLCGGVDPRAALEGIASPLLTEALQWSYNALWVTPLGLLAWLAWRGDPPVVARGALALAGALCLTFVGFFVVPATGPSWHVVLQDGTAGPLLPPALHFLSRPVSGVFAADWLRRGMTAADFNPFTTLPCGHVAATVVCAAIAFRVSRRVGWLFLPLAAAGVLSTVYLRYHYVVDGVLGILCGLVVLPLLVGRAASAPAPTVSRRGRSRRCASRAGP